MKLTYTFTPEEVVEALKEHLFDNNDFQFRGKVTANVNIRGDAKGYTQLESISLSGTQDED